MIEVFDRKLSGGSCYVGNVDIGLPLENALKAGLIQKNILQTFSIETDLNLESFKVSPLQQ